MAPSARRAFVCSAKRRWPPLPQRSRSACCRGRSPPLAAARSPSGCRSSKRCSAPCTSGRSTRTPLAAAGFSRCAAARSASFARRVGPACHRFGFARASGRCGITASASSLAPANRGPSRSRRWARLAGAAFGLRCLGLRRCRGSPRRRCRRSGAAVKSSFRPHLAPYAATGRQVTAGFSARFVGLAWPRPQLPIRGPPR